MLTRLTLIVAIAGFVAAANAQDSIDPDFDECGTIVRGTNCILFDGGGGLYYLTDFYGYQVGDEIRVVGTLMPDCTTICADADGCIADAIVYDPDVYPCSRDVGEDPTTIITDACTTLSLGLLALVVFGMYVTRPKAAGA